MNNRPHTQHGFTVPEVILIVSALAIVSAMAMPDIAYFMGRQTVEQEKLSLGNIQKALDSYARECRKLPQRENNPPRSDCNDPDVAPGSGKKPWYEALSAFSNMSAKNIQKDVWDNDRIYTHGTNKRSYREGDVFFHYATVRSIGPDRKDSTSGDDEGADWAISDSDVSAYTSFKPKDDDLMVKYTDSQWKVEAQDESVQRMQRITDALDRYAQARFNEDMNKDEDCISEKIYYPPSVPSEPAAHKNDEHPNEVAGCGDLGTSIDDRYGDAVLTDVFNFTKNLKEKPTPRKWIYTQVGDNTTRKEEMEALMRILGLPEDHCCSPITNEAFYYYSNPPGDGSYRTMPPYFAPQVRIEKLTLP